MRAAERCVNFSSHNQRRFSATSSWACEIGDRHEWGDKKGKLGIAKLPRGWCAFPLIATR